MDKLILFVEYPPPFNGQSRNSQRLVNFLQKKGFQVRIFSYNSTAQVNKRSFLHYYNKSLQFLKSVVTYLFQGDTLYMCLESRKGIIFGIIISWVAQIGNKKLIFHFRTREFLHANRGFFKMVNWNYKKLHCIVLCNTYKKQLNQKYAVRNISVISNLVFYENLFQQTQSIGTNYVFFSNMIASKGVLTFVGLARRNPNKAFILAGKNASSRFGKELERLCKNIQNLTYAPHIVDIDVILPLSKCLIFPTEYPIEVEPNVVYEFHLKGIQVITSDIGCLSELEGRPGISICSGSGDELQNNIHKAINENIADFSFQDNIDFYEARKKESTKTFLRVFDGN